MNKPPDPSQSAAPKSPRVLNRKVFFKGKTIMEQGSEGYEAYFIEAGRVEVLLQNGGHVTKLSELGPGEIFGEMALLENEKRSATVRAIEDTTVAVISEKELEDKLSAIKDRAISALIRILIVRLRHANQKQAANAGDLARFQDAVTGLMEKGAQGIREEDRARFRNEVVPLLEKLDALLAGYGTR